MYKEKLKSQLGMNPSTASGRLLKDLLFQFVINAGHKCFQCGETLTRDTFSVEHKIPWRNSEDPPYNFFNLENIAFSHLKCNSSAARRLKSITEDTGRRLSPEHREVVIRTLNHEKGVKSPRSRGRVFTSSGVFESTREAAKTLNCLAETIMRRCNKKEGRWKEWYYEDILYKEK